MVSFKKSLMIIFLILFINVNHPCSANEDRPKAETNIPEYKLMLEALKTADIKEDMRKHKEECISGVELICKGHENSCNNFEEFVKTLFESFIAYSDSDELLVNPHVISILYFVMENIETKKIKNPEDYCYEVSTGGECIKLMVRHGFIDKINKKRYINNVRVMIFKWSYDKISNYTTNSKELLSAYIKHHVDGFSLKKDSPLSKVGNIPKFYCEKKMCKYELHSVFKDMSMFTSFKDRNKKFINYAFKNIIINKVQFPTAKYFAIYLYMGIVVPNGKPITAHEFCKPYESPSKKQFDDCLYQINQAISENSVDEIVEKLYFEWSLARAREVLRYNGSTLETYMLDVSKEYTVSYDALKYGHCPDDFCEATELA